MMKLRPTSALLGLLLLTAGTFRSEAADSAKPALALDGIFDVPGNIFNLGTNGKAAGFSWEYLLTPLDGSQSRSAVLRSLATYAEAEPIGAGSARIQPVSGRLRWNSLPTAPVTRP